MTADPLPLVSVVFVSYNRAHTLVTAYETLLAFTDYPRERLELVLADDNSDEFTRAVIDQLPFDKRAIAVRNSGLGANQNQGIRAAGGDFLLMIQDDWMLVGRGDYLRLGLRALRENPDIGMISFVERPELVGESRPLGDIQVQMLEAKLELDGALSRQADSPYSDQPHLKRRDFHEVVGYYSERDPIDRLELEFARRFHRQDRYRIACLAGVFPFKSIGDRFTFNPGNIRMKRIERIRRLPGGAQLIGFMRWAWRLMGRAAG